MSLDRKCTKMKELKNWGQVKLTGGNAKMWKKFVCGRVGNKKRGASEQNRITKERPRAQKGACRRHPHLSLTFLIYSTVTDLAKLRGQSTLQPRRTAMWYESNCMGITVRIPWRQSTVCGTSTNCEAYFCVSKSPFSQTIMGRPSRAVTCWRALMHF